MNQNSDKPTVWKKELIPELVKKDSELTKFYESTDLEFSYVYECSKSLKPLKSIDVNLQQVEFWYKEFLRMGWTKKIFDKQFEAIKRATLYNRIDFENWVNAEVMYNEADLNLEVERRINNLINRGKMLKNVPVLIEEEKKMVEIALAKELEFKFNQRRYELMEDYKERMKREYLENLSATKKRIASLSIQEKVKLLDSTIDAGKIKCEKAGFAYNVILHNLEDYSEVFLEDYSDIINE